MEGWLLLRLHPQTIELLERLTVPTQDRIVTETRQDSITLRYEQQLQMGYRYLQAEYASY